MKPDGITELYIAVGKGDAVTDEIQAEQNKSRLEEAFRVCGDIFDHLAAQNPPLKFHKTTIDKKAKGIEAKHETDYEILPVPVTKVEFDGEGESVENYGLFLVKQDYEYTDDEESRGRKSLDFLIGPCEPLDATTAECVIDWLEEAQTNPNAGTSSFGYVLGIGSEEGDKSSLWVPYEPNRWWEEHLDSAAGTLGVNEVEEFIRRLRVDLGLEHESPMPAHS
jgi:hypothetical protein